MEVITNMPIDIIRYLTMIMVVGPIIMTVALYGIARQGFYFMG